ncbi:MAG: hypothetical protein CMN58_01540 [Solibacterales bacterium]|nr:hypothetical protein [Bryobacterales bacterium]|tara:strand:- start:19474 stop:21276 length:1803 start_codon:yes stop_codon:yes gene_type:complete
MGAIYQNYSSVAMRLMLVVLFVAMSPAPADGEVVGSVSGLVHDARGMPQIGATVTLLTSEGRVVKRVLTDYRGIFKVASVFPGSYSISVTLDRFLPLLKEKVDVNSGRRTILDIRLRALFASLQLAFPGSGEIRDMSEDWKWVLRTATSTRPVLRFLPEETRETRSVIRKLRGRFSDTHGYAEVSAGGGARQSALANETDLGTAFAVATSLMGNNDVFLSGNLGYGAMTGAPTAAFRTSYSRPVGVMAPEVSVTVRQLQVPVMAGNALFGPQNNRSAPALQTVSVEFDDKLELGEAASLEYGFLYESVTFLDRLNFVSPWGRFAYRLGKGREIQLRFASGLPRSQDAVVEHDMLRRRVTSLGLFPRIALHDGNATVQRTEHVEIAYRENIGDNGMIEAGAYHDSISDAAISAYVPAGYFADGNVLPNLFGNSSTLNGGMHRTTGYRVSYARKLRDHLQAAVGYGFGGALTARENMVQTEKISDMRASLKMRRAHMLMASVSMEFPRVGTSVASSYQWLNRQAVIASDLYNDFAASSAPGFNIVIRQPIPATGSLPGKFEATADFRNLFKSGYVPIPTYDSRQMFLLQAIRSYRGALSYIF